MDDPKTRKTHVLFNLRPSGDDGKLAKVIGTAFALLGTDAQSKIAAEVIASSKKQHRVEILDACVASEIPIEDRIVAWVRSGTGPLPPAPAKPATQTAATTTLPASSSLVPTPRTST